MVYILIVIGLSLIAIGKFFQKKYRVDFIESEFIDEIYSRNEKVLAKPKESKTEPLEKRIEILEQMLFSKLLEEQKNEKAVETELEDDREEDSYEKYLMIKKHERQKKSLDEIAKLLNINKGEVMLLKNLYKNS